MSRQLLDLERLVALSEAMADAAAAEQWEQLVGLGEDRDALVATLPIDLERRLPSAEKARARALIERSQALDATTRQRVEERQSALRVMLGEKIA